MSLKALSKCVCGFVVPSMHVYLCLCACPDRQMTRVSHSVVAMGCLPLSLYLYLLSLPLSLSSLSLPLLPSSVCQYGWIILTIFASLSDCLTLKAAEQWADSSLVSSNVHDQRAPWQRYKPSDKRSSLPLKVQEFHTGVLYCLIITHESYVIMYVINKIGPSTEPCGNL